MDSPLPPDCASLPPAVLAIDGPVGVGKSSVARRVAAQLGLRHLDTGAMYRAIAWVLAQNGTAHGVPLKEILGTVRIDLPEDGRILVNGCDVSLAIREESISRLVSRVADDMAVRQELVRQQRRLGLEGPSVLEGRDIGTVVFPDAACKVFLDASPRERARRRVEQLQAMGKEAGFGAVLAALEERDARDRSRSWGALRLAEGAVLVDSTHLSEAEVVELICALVRGTPAFARREAAAVVSAP